jgi:hypothetical protein
MPFSTSWKPYYLFIYVAAIFVVGYVRLWTEGGFWYAIHTGRTFMLQAGLLSLGIGFSHVDQVRRVQALEKVIPRHLLDQAQDAITPTLSGVLSDPEDIFLLGIIFLVFYLLSAFPEQAFLKDVGNPPHARKYKSNVNQEPSVSYKCWIGSMLWVGLLCLLAAWYVIAATGGRGVEWYLWRFIIPAHILLASILFIAPGLSYAITGTRGRRQRWDTTGNPRQEE